MRTRPTTRTRPRSCTRAAASCPPPLPLQKKKVGVEKRCCARLRWVTTWRRGSRCRSTPSSSARMASRPTATGRPSAPRRPRACCVGLNEQKARYLLSYAAQQASGISCWMRDEEHVEKAFDFGGMPARNGVTAASMVAQGFSGVEDVFSGERNFFVAHGRPADPEEAGARAGRGLRDPAHQHQALVGRLADPGAARLACDSHPGARREGGAGREAHHPRGAPRQEHHRQPSHARHQHAAHVRGDADGRHGDVQVRAR